MAAETQAKVLENPGLPPDNDDAGAKTADTDASQGTVVEASGGDKTAHSTWTAPSDAAKTEPTMTMQEASAKSPLVMALLHLKWANFLQKAGQHDKAIVHFESSLALKPSARAHFGRGTCLATLRRREEAVEALEEALAISPDLAGVHVNLAGVHLALRHFAEAEDHCRKALAIEPGAREAVMNLGNALRNLGRREEAVQEVWQHIVAAQSASASVSSTVPPALDDAGRAPDATRAAPPSESVSCTAADNRSPAILECSAWTSLHAEPSLVIVCVKWGKRYDAAYVNRLYAGVRRNLKGRSPEEVPFVCFTDDAAGLVEGIEARSLPKDSTLWWGKAYLFSEEAGLDGNRVLFLDLDQVIVADLGNLAAYRGPFAVLATDGISCELAGGGYNSSVISWEASTFFRPIYTRLTKAALKFVHRFDHWLEMNVHGAGLWQQLAPGLVIDYTAAFRGGVCIGSSEAEESLEEERAMGGAFVEGGSQAAAQEPDGTSRGGMEDIPAGAAVITFPRSPKPHEVVDRHAWVRQHWLGEVSECAKPDQ